MKNKAILSLAVLIGISIGSVFTACSNKSSQAQASEKSSQAQVNKNGYLKYCGTQNKLFGDVIIPIGDKSSISVYEDIQHKKVIYVGTDGYNDPITISVSDLPHSEEK